MAPTKLQRERHDCYSSTVDKRTDSFMSFTSLILKATLHAMLVEGGLGGGSFKPECDVKATIAPQLF